MAEGTAYTSKYLKKLLSNHYGSHIKFLDECGKPTLIFLVDMTQFIVDSRRKQGSVNTETEVENILESAALIIKTGIREKITQMNIIQQKMISLQSGFQKV